MSPSQVVWTAAAGGDVPAGAVVGGFEANGTPLYVCRASYSGGVHVGKIVGRNCNFGWGGREILASDYEVLVGDFSRWVGASDGTVPSGAIEGGRESNGTVLYICRATHRGGTQVGKLVGRNCNFGWGGAEVSAPRYEVLVR